MGADADMDFRSMVEGAWNEAEAASSAGSDGNGDGSALQSGGHEPAVSSPIPEGTDLRTSDTPQSADGDLGQNTQGRTRDASGRFAPKTATQTTTKAPQVSAQASTPTQDPAGVPPSSSGAPIAATAPTTFKPPQSWTPSEREHFAKAPAEVQAAIARVDREVRQVMQESAPARKFHQEFQQTVMPYMPLLRAEGVADPMQAMTATLNLLTVMRTGTPQQRAHTVAKFVHQYGVDVAELDNALANGGQNPNSPPPQQFRDPRFDQLLSHLQTQHQQRAQKTHAQQVAEAEAFAADPANEFFEDVRHDMADFIEAAKLRGTQVGIKEAYERAVWANPGIRAILQKRATAEAAKAATASTQQARLAASSVKSTPTTGASAPKTPKTHREMVEAAWESLEGR